MVQLPFARGKSCATLRARLDGNGLLTLTVGFDAITVPFGERLYVRSH
jgi:hypothetical protein